MIGHQAYIIYDAPDGDDDDSDNDLHISIIYLRLWTITFFLLVRVFLRRQLLRRICNECVATNIMQAKAD
jgi:hypothetical protein